MDTPRILVLAPHADDETLGMGGTMAKHLDEGDEVHVAIVTGPGAAEGGHPFMEDSIFETVRAEARRALEGLGVTSLTFGDLPAVAYPQSPVWEVNRHVHDLIAAIRPDVLYVPFPYDLHNDHRALFHAASVAWRPAHELGRSIRRVLAYEVQSETHWNAPYLEPGFLPTVWVGLSEAQLAAKLRALGAYTSQMRPFPDARSIEAVEHLARWRGAQQGMHAAEGFVLVKEVRP